MADLTLENRLLKKHERGWGGRGMRYPASEKAEIIELVEQSHLPAKRTLDKLGIPRATFYAGVIDTVKVGPRRWVTTAPDQIVSGTGSRTMSTARSSTWHWIFQSCRRESWRYGSRREVRHRSIGY